MGISTIPLKNIAITAYTHQYTHTMAVEWLIDAPNTCAMQQNDVGLVCANG